MMVGATGAAAFASTELRLTFGLGLRQPTWTDGPCGYAALPELFSGLVDIGTSLIISAS